MMYFFPIKVQEQKERIERKKLELELYKKIINDSLSYMKQKIQENRHKQNLATQINDYVGQEIDSVLELEEAFYLSAEKDQLKVPPFVHVKRIERPGVTIEHVNVPAVGRSNQRKLSKSKSRERERTEHQQLEL